MADPKSDRRVLVFELDLAHDGTVPVNWQKIQITSGMATMLVSHPSSGLAEDVQTLSDKSRDLSSC
jgi:hypothetical protein